VRIIAGLEHPTSGTVLVHDAPVSNPGQSCSMVFQSYTSFPWLTVLENIEFGLRYTSKAAKQNDVRRRRISGASAAGVWEFPTPGHERCARNPAPSHVVLLCLPLRYTASPNSMFSRTVNQGKRYTIETPYCTIGPDY